eukprot:CAMPEP_0115204436 /NCGR_PEP_ID=MMETSP0270-20121206/19168_1 /TAXON_ID=71861 /ORGANISM="Scrippsiella trochoidea, Strain CCMP3099" /LENGTH=374 /DNA_ID=CAMNT_0002617935 /DNA_START=56 /DNA_END=1180 /DNA_ORIENTATION=-
MPVKGRPEPLLVDCEETDLCPAPSTAPAGATLLGRTRNATVAVKKPLAEAASSGHAVMPSTPGTMKRLTPLARQSPQGSVRGGRQPLQQSWGFIHPFTPITTPSPTGGLGLFHRDLRTSAAESAVQGDSSVAATGMVADRHAEGDHIGSDDESDDDDSSQIQTARQPADAPRRPKGALHPSLGSEGHAIGACKRCCFFSRGRCANGYECQFCHYEHEKRKRKNKKAATKKAINGLAAAHGSGARNIVGMTMPGCLPQASMTLAAPIGYSSAQVLSMASQQNALAPCQLTNGTYCVVQPGHVLVAPTGIAPVAVAGACGGVPQQQQQQQQQQLLLQQQQQQLQLQLLQQQQLQQLQQQHLQQQLQQQQQQRSHQQ